MMREIFVTNQGELDDILVSYDGIIIIEFGTVDKAAIIHKKFVNPVIITKNSRAVLRGNSSAELWENSSAELRENSSAVLLENSSAELWGNSSVVLCGNSRAVLRGNSSALLLDNSSAVLLENSSAEAKHNSQIVDRTFVHNIKISGNSRILRDPKNIEEYIKLYNIDRNENTVRLFKAVHKVGNKYMADWTKFEYVIGKTSEADMLTTDARVSCGHGIHMAYKEWCMNYGAKWPDLAILEMEAEIDDVIIPINSGGKVRAAKAKVIREVPLEECGLYGKLLMKRR